MKHNHLIPFGVMTAVLGFQPVLPSVAQVILFNETFDGYTSFPDEIPPNDFVNKGIPEIAEGANEFWYGARFQNGDGTIDSDLFVQRYGDSNDGQTGINNTPVGRFEDDTGLVLCIDTTGYVDVTLTFDWRTFSEYSSDKVTVGYFVGELGFDTGANRYLDLQTGSGSWSNWEQLLSAGGQHAFKSESFNLTLADNAEKVYVALWLDNGEGDYGKVDNIKIVAANPIPEPTSIALALLGLAGLGSIRFRTLNNQQTMKGSKQNI